MKWIALLMAFLAATELLHLAEVKVKNELAMTVAYDRQAAALERIAAAAEARPARAAAIKTVSCGATMDACAEPAARRADDKSFERDLERTEKAAWDRVIERLPGRSTADCSTCNRGGGRVGCWSASGTCEEPR